MNPCLKPHVLWFGLYLIKFWSNTIFLLSFLPNWLPTSLPPPLVVSTVGKLHLSPQSGTPVLLGCFVDGQRTPVQTLFIFLHKHPSNVFMIGKAKHMSKHLLKSLLPFNLCINNLILSFPPFLHILFFSRPRNSTQSYFCIFLKVVS